MKTILIIEDDVALVQGLEEALKAEHYNVISAYTGEKGHTMAKRENVALIILDLILPDKSGEDICHELRQDGISTPILMLTSKKQEIDELIGYEIGANHYVTKPFSIRVLIARIKAMLRPPSEGKKDIEEYTFGDVYIDFKKQEAMKNRQTIKLTPREFKILKFFAQYEGEVVSRDMLLNGVWGYENFPSTRTIDNFILSIRKKIEDNASKPKHLITVHTAGYKFVK